MAKPSPDWDLITFKWAAVKIDGTPETGSIMVKYNGGVLLDDDPSLGGTPLLIFPTELTFPISTVEVVIGGETRSVGYAEFQVPASNDPDISGGGGTYTITEVLSGNRRRAYSVIADINAPGRTVWLSKIAPSDPSTGAPLSVVYYEDFTALESRVTVIEENGGGTGGGVTSYDDLTDKPFIPTTPADIGAQPSGNYVSSTDSRMTNARPPTAHQHIIDDIPGLRDELNAAAGSTGGNGIGNTVTLNGATTTRSHPVSGTPLPLPPECIVFWVADTAPTFFATGDTWIIPTT